ncbi:MAG TPA: DUF4157 domain-containing protein [Myxococcota bacterium]|nr:DUF4157 domain-containing protein [Myxococcota bacterium]
MGDALTHVARAVGRAPATRAKVPAGPGPGGRARAAGPAFGGRLQAKLEIGGHDDPQEREADRAASALLDTVAVGSAANNGARRAPAGPVARRSAAPAGGAPGDGRPAARRIAEAIERRRGGGQPLPVGTRARMEAGLGFDFASVRVHADAEADALSAGIGARAFTHGADVYFRAGAYDPQSRPGAWLLAHELTHVAQQSAAGEGGTGAVAGGNAGVLQRKCACGAGAGRSGSCEECEDEAAAAGGTTRVQRFAEESGAGEGTAARAPAPEPEREAAAAEPGPAAGAAGGALIADDDAATLAPGQMRKSEFIEAARVGACASADEAMARVGRSTEGCPYVERALAYYAQRDAAHVERAMRRFVPEAAAARTARDYLPLFSARIARGVERWATTGEMPDVPEELRAHMMGGGLGGVVASVFGAVGRAFSALARALFKPRDGGGAAGPGAEPNVALGPGRPLDGAAQARMERAFGHGFGGVRVHTDRAAADLSRAFDARAFTVGERIVFGAGEYHPGDPAGDALLAHELAHVVQQEGADPGTLTPAALHAGGRGPLEHDADRAAAGATIALWSGRPDAAPDEPAARRLGRTTGLRLQRCGAASSQQPGPAAAGGLTPKCELPDSASWSKGVAAAQQEEDLDKQGTAMTALVQQAMCPLATNVFKSGNTNSNATDPADNQPFPALNFDVRLNKKASRTGRSLEPNFGTNFSKGKTWYAVLGPKAVDPVGAVVTQERGEHELRMIRNAPSRPQGETRSDEELFTWTQDFINYFHRFLDIPLNSGRPNWSTANTYYEGRTTEPKVEPATEGARKAAIDTLVAYYKDPPETPTKKKKDIQDELRVLAGRQKGSLLWDTFLANLPAK